jgi:hypothetical protein
MAVKVSKQMAAALGIVSGSGKVSGHDRETVKRLEEKRDRQIAALTGKKSGAKQQKQKPPEDAPCYTLSKHGARYVLDLDS